MTRNKIRICHILSRLDVGGMENGVANLCNGLDQERFDSTICCLHGLGPILNRLKSDVTVKSFDFPNGLNPFRFLKVAAYLSRLKPDIVHTHGWGAGLLDGFIAGRLARVPVLINGEHGSFFESPTQVKLQRLLLARFDRILAVSEVLKKRVAGKFSIPPEKITVIHNGVDIIKYHNNMNKAEIIHSLNREGIQLSSTDFIIGCVGSLRPVKNQTMLLNALNCLKGFHSRRIVLLLIGVGPDQEMLQQMCAEYGIADDVYFMGQRTDVAELYNIFDVLVQCSHSEGMSNVILESMASGVPVVCTKGCDEEAEIIDNWHNGIVVENDDVNGMVKGLQLLSEHVTRDIYSRKSKKIILNKYTITCMVDSYSQCYMESLIR